MAYPNSRTKYFDDLNTSTLDRVIPRLTDNFFDNTPVLRIMKSKGKLVDHSGGTIIEMPIEYAENETVGWIGRGSKVSIEDNQKYTMLKYDWKWMAGSVVRYYTDEKLNKGDAQVFNLVEKNIKNLEKSMTKAINTALMGDGSEDSNMLEGFKKYVESTPAVGTVGGINSANYSWWRNQHTSMSGEDHTVYLVDRMREMWDDCSGDNGETDTPQIIITTKGIRQWYEDEMLDSHFYSTSNDMADLGIKGCSFKGAPMMWTSECDAGLMYFLNLDYFEIAYDPSGWMEQTGWKNAQDNLERAQQVVCQMNLICSNRKQQGLISAITT